MNNTPQSELERLKDDYEIYLSCADDGKGGDITRNGVPLSLSVSSSVSVAREGQCA